MGHPEDAKPEADVSEQEQAAEPDAADLLEQAREAGDDDDDELR